MRYSRKRVLPRGISLSGESLRDEGFLQIFLENKRIFAKSIRDFFGSEIHVFLYKKLGSGHSTKSFLIQHEILSIIVLKVS